MAYGLTDIQSLVRQFARNAQDPTVYTGAYIDNAIQLAADEWLRITKATRTLSQLALTAGTATLPSFPTNFLPEFLLDAYLTGFTTPGYGRAEMIVTTLDKILDAQNFNLVNCTFPATPPQLLAFDSQSTGLVYPTPTTNLTLNLWWWQPFTQWVAGTNPSTVTSFNLPDDALRVICSTGAVYYLQRYEPNNAASAQAAYAAFLAQAKVFKSRAAGSRGPQTLLMNSPYGCGGPY